MKTDYDVAIVGGGPAGATCAALCATGGLRTLLLERATFPRDKVCGDCLNPSCWPILERLGVIPELLAAPHSTLEYVEYVGTDHRILRFALAAQARSEITIQRRVLDQLLLQRARANGTQVLENTVVTGLEPGWKITTPAGTFTARTLVGADGRNSTVARLLGLLPTARKDRIAQQTHFPTPPGFGKKVVMQFTPEGYCGLATIEGGLANLCLVSRPAGFNSIRHWAEKTYGLPPEHHWNTITPLSRARAVPSQTGLLLVGDAAQVVEPFTGEGIYYALATGALAADFLVEGRPLADFETARRRLYRGRLWVNQLARLVCLHPQLATLALRAFRWQPELLRLLTAKVTGAARLATAPADAAPAPALP